MRNPILLSLLVAVLVVGGAFAIVSGSEAQAADIAVVDTARILTQSKPAQAGESHLWQVRQVLQKGLSDLQSAYKGKEKSPEAQEALLQGQVALERQLELERQAVLLVLNQALEQAVRQWRTTNSRYVVVMSRQNLLDSAPTADVTDSILKELDKIQPTFPPLPKVTVNQPAAGAATKAAPIKAEQEKTKPAQVRQPVKK